MTKFWRTQPILMAIGALMAMATLSGCATTATETKTGGDPLRSLAVWAGFATNAEEPADFVKATRPATLDFTPVGVTPAGPKKNARKLTPEELKALEAELEAARAKNEAVGSVTP